MKLASGQISGFLKQRPADVPVVLLYGPDTGLARERAESLAKAVVPDLQDPFRTASLTPAAISDDAARLHDEVAAQALGGGGRLVRIIGATEAITAALKSLLEDWPSTDCLLLIEAGDLDKRSKLRALCEASPHAAAIPCYLEEGPARTRIISDILQSGGLDIDRDALAFLGDVLPPDRQAMRSELDKLVLYIGTGSTTVSIDDVHAVVQDAGAAELDDLIFAVGSGDSRRAAQLMDRLLDEQTSPVAILRAAQRHFLRLQSARYTMDQGSSAGDAVKRLQPPVFWKYQDNMVAQLRRWPAAKIKTALARLLDAEAAVKRSGTPDEALTAQLLLVLAA